jgi:predicted nucleotidyltransferase
MPVRSLNSAVLEWPDAGTVESALRSWAGDISLRRADVLLLGYFGSYARGDAGVGSDLDIIVVVESSDEPFERRRIGWNTSALPVPADLLIYTRDEWAALSADGRFRRTVEEEAVWLIGSAIRVVPGQIDIS